MKRFFAGVDSALLLARAWMGFEQQETGGGIPGSFDPPAADWFDETSILRKERKRVRVPLSSASLKGGRIGPAAF